jgi:hypothetical protein
MIEDTDLVDPADGSHWAVIGWAINQEKYQLAERGTLRLRLITSQELHTWKSDR